MPRPPFQRFPKDRPLSIAQRSELTKAFKNVNAGAGGATTTVVVPGGSGGSSGITQAQINSIVSQAVTLVLAQLGNNLGMVIDQFTPSGAGPYALSETPVGDVATFTDAGFEPLVAASDVSTPGPQVASGVLNFVNGYDTTQIVNTVCCVYLASI